MPDKKTRVPKSAESIYSGAAKLPLSVRIELCKQLHLSIDAEVKLLQEKANEACTLVAQLNGK